MGSEMCIRDSFTIVNNVADAAMIAGIPTTAIIVWRKSPAVMPAPVAMPTLVPDVVALATVNSVAGPGIKRSPERSTNR